MESIAALALCADGRTQQKRSFQVFKVCLRAAGYQGMISHHNIQHKIPPRFRKHPHTIAVVTLSHTLSMMDLCTHTFPRKTTD